MEAGGLQSMKEQSQTRPGYRHTRGAALCPVTSTPRRREALCPMTSTPRRWEALCPLTSAPLRDKSKSHIHVLFAVPFFLSLSQLF